MGNRTRAGMEDAGSRKAKVSGEWQQALGSSLNAGGNLSLNAGQDMTLQGSQVKAGGTTQLQAGGEIKLLAETTTNTTHLKANSSTSSVRNTRQEDRLLLSTLSGDQGVMLVAGKNLRVEGAQVDSEKGSIGVSAQDVIIKEARQVVIDQDSEKKREGKTKIQREMETVRDSGIGSTFSGEKGVTVIAREGDIAVAGSTLHSEDGAIALQAKRDVVINSATDRESQFSEERSVRKKFLSKKSTRTVKDDRSTLEQGSLLSGKTSASLPDATWRSWDRPSLLITMSPLPRATMWISSRRRRRNRTIFWKRRKRKDCWAAAVSALPLAASQHVIR